MSRSMQHIAALAAILLGVCPMVHGQPRPQLVETLFPTDDHAIASLVVSPPAETEDATPVLQAAIDELRGIGGGVVFARAGRYLLASPLIVREGVTLRGDWAPQAAGKKHDPPRTLEGRVGEGTLLMPTANRGTTEGPAAITLERGSGLREVAIWYPEQRADDVVPYPWAIHSSTEVAGDNYTVENVTLVNPYLGIGIGPEWNELHTIRNVSGTPLKLGIFVDTTTDIGRLSRIDFSADCWEGSGLPGAPTTPAERAALRERLMAEATGYELGRSDWEYLYETSAFGYGTGILFRAGAQGTTNAQMFGGTLSGCGIGLDIRELNGVGLMVTGATIEGCTGAAVSCAASLRGSCVQLQECTLSSTDGECVRNAGSSTITLQGCNLREWTGAAIRMERGMLGVQACQFAPDGVPVSLGVEVGQARIFNSRLGPEQVVPECSPAAVMVGDGEETGATADTSDHYFPPTPHPAQRALFVVTDYGASPDLADNTAAFQAALDAAGAGGGGTVYVPAGDYPFAGSLRVPSGVELRGIFDVPHHTISAGSVLMPTAGRDDENGTPFVQLEEGAGVRGLTFWYPEQDLTQVHAYPWTVRSLGPGCWLVDCTIGNGYQGVDFASYPSDGHLVRYLAGGFLKKGLFVSKCATRGTVEDVMYNPHFMARIPASFAKGPWAQVNFEALVRHVRENLWGIALGSCADEAVCGTFLYAAYAGFTLYDDNGGPNARVIGHGTDTGSCGVLVQATGERGVSFLNAQLVPLSHVARGAIVTEPSFAGSVRFFNTQVWAGDTTAALDGPGEVLIQQMNTLTGPVRIRAGKAAMVNTYFQPQGLDPHIEVGPGVDRALLLGNLTGGLVRVANGIGERLYARGNSVPVRKPLDPNANYRFATGWEDGEPQGIADAIADPGGGLRSVSEATCRPEEGPSRTGTRALHLRGNADDPDYSFVYFRVLEDPVAIAQDTVLRYWIRPENERGRNVGVDLIFADGGTLRQSILGVHPGATKGPAGEWSEVVVPLGALEGQRIAQVMLAYDSRGGGGPFGAWIDDLSISTPETGGSAAVTATPAAGYFEQATEVALACPEAARIRYTLDGSEPGPASPVYEGPIRLPDDALTEIRAYPEDANGGRIGPTTAGLWEVRP